MGDLFSQIFERNGQWLTGRYIASEIIRFQQDKSPIVERDPQDDNGLIITVPRPSVKNEVDGSHVSIDCMVPPELSTLYRDRLAMAMEKWINVNPIAWGKVQDFLYQPLTDYTLMHMNGVLREAEYEVKARGEKPEMWMITADMFGFSRWNVPNLRLSPEIRA